MKKGQIVYIQGKHKAKVVKIYKDSANEPSSIEVLPLEGIQRGCEGKNFIYSAGLIELKKRKLENLQLVCRLRNRSK